MNKEFMKHFGFNKEVDLVEQGKCPLCKKDIVPIIDSFINQESFKDYQISGLCQECQDSIFSDLERRCVQCECLKNNSDYTFVILYYQSVEGKLTHLCQDCLERGLQYNRNLIDQFIGLLESSLSLIEFYAPELGQKHWKGSIIEYSSTVVKHFKADTLYLLACDMILMMTNQKGNN